MLIVLRLFHIIILSLGNPFYVWAGNYMDILILCLLIITLVNHAGLFKFLPEVNYKMVYHYALLSGLILLLLVDINNNFFEKINLGPIILFCLVFLSIVYLEKIKLENKLTRFLYFIIITLLSADIYFRISQFNFVSIIVALMVFIVMNYFFVIESS